MKTIIHTCVFVILSLYGCQTVVEVEIPDRPSELVLNAITGTDSTWAFTLSSSKGMLESGDLKPVLNGKITINGSDGSSETLTETTEILFQNWPMYVGTQQLREGVTYTVTAEAPGFSKVSAIETVPDAKAIERIDTASVLVDGIEATEVRITFTDPSATADFYDIKLFAVTEVPYDTATGSFEPTTYVSEIPYRIASESFFGSGSLITAFEDVTFNGRTYTHVISFDNYYLDQFGLDSLASFLPIKLVAELRTVSEAYYLYRVSSDTYQRTSFDPFAQPVQVYNNVEGGFGIIATYSLSRDTLSLQ